MTESKKEKPQKPKTAWNKGKSVGQMKPFTPKQVRTIKELLETEENLRDIALFSMGIDTMLRSSDILNLTVKEVINTDGTIKKRFFLLQKKTGKSNLVSLSHKTQELVLQWIKTSKKYPDDYIFTGLTKKTCHTKLSHMQYTRLVKKWAESIKLNPKEYSTHSIRRTKAAYIYQMTGNIEAVRQLLGQKDVSATSYYLNISKHQALDIAEAYEL